MYSKYYYDWKPSHYGIEKRGSDRFVLNFLWLSREIWQLKLEEKRNYDHILWVSEAGKFADSEVVSSSGRISDWFFAKLMNTWKRKYERWGNNLQMYMSNLITKYLLICYQRSLQQSKWLNQRIWFTSN